MRERIARFIRGFGDALVQMLHRHPIELAIAIGGCVGCIVLFNVGSDSPFGERLWPRLALTPLFFVLALVVNLLAGRGAWRRVYYVCWTPYLFFAAWGGLADWFGTLSHHVTLGVLIPLALLMATRARNNRRFVGDAVVWLRAWGLAIFFANVVLGLFCAIFYSTTYIFGLQGDWIDHTATYALILCETLLVPVLALTMCDRWLGHDGGSSRIVDILLNYLVTPALLIYMAILDLYILKIVFTWSLPVGGVAYMVFGFAILAVVVKALQEILGCRTYGWLFDRLSLYVLPAVVLFWVGVLQRVSEYGLTADRVWLLVCGGVMTLSLTLLLTRRTGRYLYVALSAFVVMAVVAYIPTLDPERMAIHSQERRAERFARSLDLLDAEGHIVMERVAQTDTTHGRALNGLYEALLYVQRSQDIDSSALGRFGLNDLEEFKQFVPSEATSAFRREHYTMEGHPVSTVGYRWLYANLSEGKLDAESPGYDFKRDTLRIGFGGDRPDFVISGRELLSTQLKRAQAGEPYDWEKLYKQPEALLTYSDETLTILFSYMNIASDPSEYSIESLGISDVLVR